jgi:hypothetical protein
VRAYLPTYRGQFGQLQANTGIVCLFFWFPRGPNTGILALGFHFHGSGHRIGPRAGLLGAQNAPGELAPKLGLACFELAGVREGFSLPKNGFGFQKNGFETKSPCSDWAAG